MTERSARLALPLLQAGQAQKELFHNEALMQLDGLLHPAVASIATVSPPTNPASGDSWIVGPEGTGPWSGMAGRMATWTDGGWRFVIPLAGMQVWLKDRGHWAWHDGAMWHGDGLPCATLSIDGKKVVGPQGAPIPDPAGGQTTDIEARTAISAILRALKGHGLIAT